MSERSGTTKSETMTETAPVGGPAAQAPARADDGVAARFGATTVRETRQLTPAARRALAEAEERRKAREAETVHAGDLPTEINGRDGPEPIRYGDWEKNGIISDF